MPDQQTMLDQIYDLMTERNQALQQAQRWREVATQFYARHYNRRNCSLIASCFECDAYEALIKEEQQ